LRETVKLFKELFECRRTGFGTFTPKPGAVSGKAEGNYVTISHRSINYDDFENHIDGKTSIGLIPLSEMGLCKWGAIDIDIYYDEKFTKDLLERIDVTSVPCVPCFSKSKGLHLYFFFASQVDPVIAKAYMKKAAAILQVSRITRKNNTVPEEVEIFPKQTQISGLGNFINMPYFGSERPAIYVDGDKIESYSLEQFLHKALSSVISEARLKEKSKPSSTINKDSDSDFAGFPPCLYQVLANSGGKIGTGDRNNWLFNVAVALRKKYAEEWQEYLPQYNTEYLDPPLSSNELEALLKRNMEYNYMCSKAPISAVCNRAVCLRQEYGVSDDKPYEFGDLTIVEGDKILYYWNINDIEVLFTAEDLLSPPKFAAKLTEATHRIMHMKKEEIQNIFNDAVKEAKYVKQHVSTTNEGYMAHLLKEFCLRSGQDASSLKKKDIIDRLRISNSPVRSDTSKFYFKPHSFYEYLALKKFPKNEKTYINKILLDKFAIEKAHLKSDGLTVTVMEVDLDAIDKILGEE
jgi:phenylpyruvate tautomerase PptA (4-oxalocrotonate tautomerase family)